MTTKRCVLALILPAAAQLTTTYIELTTAGVQVWHIAQTGEVFLAYEDYLDRFVLSQALFQCAGNPWEEKTNIRQTGLLQAGMAGQWRFEKGLG
jgi:hypothetical protein